MGSRSTRPPATMAPRRFKRHAIGACRPGTETVPALGTIVQMVPTNLMAFAQHDPGNLQWVSAEVDNNGIFPMNEKQLTAAKNLFGWLCTTYGVPRQLATGCLFSSAKQFDEITMSVCEAAGSDVTPDPFWAAMSRGVSCHWWLDPVKSGKGVHACPGKGILSQLGSIAKPGLF